MQKNYRNISVESSISIDTNKVLRNTYALLAISILFSAMIAYYSSKNQVLYINPLFMFVGIFGLNFLIYYLRNSVLALPAVFLFTGFLGYSLGPVLNIYMIKFANGGEIITSALACTGIIFFALSGYVLTSRKNFSFMGGFLFVALIAILVLALANLIFQLTMLSLMISFAAVLISSGLILYQTSEIINGGETNYVLATVSLYSSLFSLFIHLLNIFGFLSGED